MGTNLNTSDIVAWHRQEAARYEKLANFHAHIAASMEDVAEIPSMVNGADEVAEIDNDGVEKKTISSEQIEQAVRQKSGRVHDLAIRLGTSSATIRGLLFPNSKVYEAPRGWLKVRD